jgi:hypothetical protein
MMGAFLSMISVLTITNRPVGKPLQRFLHVFSLLADTYQERSPSLSYSSHLFLS